MRPSSTAIVPGGTLQCCSIESALAFTAPHAAPVAPAFWPPGVTMPPHAARREACAVKPAAFKTSRLERMIFTCLSISLVSVFGSRTRANAAKPPARRAMSWSPAIAPFRPIPGQYPHPSD
ncbi:hypothetical protein X946_3765 [Burkholderia sp. ABCPW 111]|nr:hypothetical protein X946_3765 [Burkholderia sp. ABCPW 111]